MSFIISDRELEVMFDGSPNGLAVFRFNGVENFICQKVNKNFLQFNGLETIEQAVGQSCDAIFQNASPQIMKFFEETVQQVEQKSKIVTVRDQTYLVVIAPIVEDDVVGSVIVSYNPSWLYSPQFYGNQKMLEAMQDAIFIFDLDEDGKFHLSFLNESHQKATGLEIERDYWKTPIELAGEVQGQEIINHYQRCVDLKETIQYREMVEMPAGSRFWETKISPVIVDGKVTQIIGAGRDITKETLYSQERDALLLEYLNVFEFNLAPMGLFDVDAENEIFRVIRFNQAYEEQVGLTTEKYAGKSLGEMLEEPAASIVQANFIKCLRTKKPFRYENEFTILGQSKVWVTLLAPIIENEKVVKIIGSSLDITEHQRNEERIQSLLDEYRTVLDSTQTVMWVNDYNEEEQSFRASRINRQYTIETGVRFEEIKGRTIFETSFEPYSTEIWNRHMDCVNQKRAITCEENLVIGKRHGTFLTTLVPIIKDGKVLQVVGSSMDITEIKENERKIQSLLDEYLTVFDATKAVLWVDDYFPEDQSFRINKINEQYSIVTGFKQEEIRGKTIFETSEEPYSSQIWQHHMDCVNQKQSITYEESPVVGNWHGTSLTTLAPIMKDGEVVQVAGSTIDITEIKNYQEQLELQSAMLAERVEERTIELKRALLDKDAFLFAMSTEVNSPVTAILGFSELLKRLSKREDAHYRYIDQIYRYTQILSSRFQELMNVVSIEGESNELNYELVDLEALCKEVLAEHQSDAERVGAVITMQFKLAVKSLWLDVPRVRLVVDKVIESALLKCNRSCSMKVLVGLDEGSQQLQFDFHHLTSTNQPVEEVYGIPREARREDPIKLLNPENFNIEAMLVERAVALLNGEITKEVPDEGQCRIRIKLPLLQKPDRVI